MSNILNNNESSVEVFNFEFQINVERMNAVRKNSNGSLQSSM